MIVYYRALGFVVLVGLGLSAALLYTTLTVLSVHQGLTLSLAGVIGVIVSVGVTVDSYVVYFERLNDEIRARPNPEVVDRPLVRSSVQDDHRRQRDKLHRRRHPLLAVRRSGPRVRVHSGLSTVYDVVVAWMFTRPTVVLLGRTQFFTSNRVFGVARGIKTAEALS